MTTTTQTPTAASLEITPRSFELFCDYARDAGNWSGSPLVGGNVGGSTEDRGNLTQLKKAGLITTFRDEGETWINFTDKGLTVAAELGILVEVREGKSPAQDALWLSIREREAAEAAEENGISFTIGEEVEVEDARNGRTVRGRVYRYTTRDAGVEVREELPADHPDRRFGSVARLHYVAAAAVRKLGATPATPAPEPEPYAETLSAALGIPAPAEQRIAVSDLIAPATEEDHRAALRAIAEAEDEDPELPEGYESPEWTIPEHECHPYEGDAENGPPASVEPVCEVCGRDLRPEPRTAYEWERRALEAQSAGEWAEAGRCWRGASLATIGNKGSAYFDALAAAAENVAAGRFPPDTRVILADGRPGTVGMYDGLAAGYVRVHFADEPATVVVDSFIVKAEHATVLLREPTAEQLRAIGERALRVRSGLEAAAAEARRAVASFASLLEAVHPRERKAILEDNADLEAVETMVLELRRRRPFGAR